ncbi:non-reducing end alpha-L-arabinofuranosidase family hydrolase [Glycomyces sp. MUSA5-2]|uniref:non-reducing end alpha-L-arabinofuranosidase family hydrolase n=1 Tax=Glycomyces sp. MUSA5-2 TaxID=2053002 RepID=UPI003007F4D4
MKPIPPRRRTRRGARTALAVTLAVGLTGAGALIFANTAQAADTLGGAAAQSGRYFGAAIAPNFLGEAQYADTLNAEFNSIVAENAMKWDATEPNRGQFNFSGGDTLVAHAEANGMEVRGHTLVWHAQQPGWVQGLTGDDLRQAMTDHIAGVAGHYQGQISSWDVVNEAFEEDGSRRQSNLQQQLGDGWIEEAFRAADAADPDARLCYNDYNTDGINAKSDGIYAMVEDFLARGVPIDCVGFQSHLSTDSNLSTYQANLERFAALGVDVEITELDVGGSGSAQADVYRTVTEACVAVDRCNGITTWGITDKYSWRGDDTPLLFDDAYQKKEAYDAVLEVLNSAAASDEPTGEPEQDQALPETFAWESTGELVDQQQTAPDRQLVSIKDPSVVNVDGQYHVYATTADTGGGWSLTYFGGFSDWSEAGDAEQLHLTTTAVGGGYRAAPQVFYFEPDDQWYLIYQTGLPSFSTLDGPGAPESASAAQNFISAHDPIVDEGSSYVVDYWVTCDEANCYMFFSNSNNTFFRMQTTVDEFPGGFGDTQVLMASPGDNGLFEALNLYKVGDTDQYLLIIEAIGASGDRYFRSWTADSLDALGDEWTPLADSESDPFAGAANVSFPGGVWTNDISHGEMVRTNPDQTMQIDPCDMQYLYQGRDPASNGMEYSQLPYRLGLLTNTNPAC